MKHINHFGYFLFGLSVLIAGQCSYAFEAELPVSILNMQYGNLLVIQNSSIDSKLWGYSPVDYRTKSAGKKNWHVTYNNNGSLSFKSLETGTCITVSDDTYVVHTNCNPTRPGQQFSPLLVSSGAVKLKNIEANRCLATNKTQYLSTYAIDLEPCADGAQVPAPANLLWAFIPAQGPSSSLLQKQDLR
jgi:hypothetical protein